MSLPVAGWYPDPAASTPAEVGRLRWWDGRGWTAALHAGVTRLRTVLATCPQRVRGYLVDAVALWTFSLLVLSPFHRTLTDELTGIVRTTLLTGSGGLPSLAVLWDYGIFQVWALAAIPGVLVRVAYDVVMLTRRGATFGHANAGVRVVEPGEAPQGPGGGITLRAALVRSLVLRIAAPTVVGWLLVVLWPLGDEQRRSLADVAAGTLVVQPGG